MKELTTEDKARRYDDAIKVADKYKDTSIMFPQIKDEMFPELAESESENKKDERIIKALIQLVTNYPSMDLFIEYDIHSYEIEEWLYEKLVAQRN